MAQRALSNEQARSVTELSALQDGSRCFRSSKFTLILTRLAPSVVLSTAIGYNSGDSAPLITAEMSRLIPATGKLHSFVNLSQQTGQASAAREWWAAWVKQNRPQLGVTHMLVRSKVMDMAISVTAMIIGGGQIKSHSSPASFEAAIAEQVPGFRALPTFLDVPALLP